MSANRVWTVDVTGKRFKGDRAYRRGFTFRMVHPLTKVTLFKMGPFNNWEIQEMFDQLTPWFETTPPEDTQ